MKIYVVAGTGYGQTLLSAFDAALYGAGVHNFNLLQLSSIIPPGTKVVVKKRVKYSPETYGNKLYVVKAEARSREMNKYLGAALGWYQFKDGRGIFVEHGEIGETEEAVRSNLEEEVKKSIADLCKVRNQTIVAKKMHIKVNIVKVEKIATCSLVLAVYKHEGWE